MSSTSQEVFAQSGGSVFAAYDVSWRGGTFTSVGNYILTSIKVEGARLGSLGTVTYALYAADGNNKPTGSILTSGSANGGAWSTDWTNNEITVSAYLMQANYRYCMVISAIGSAGNYLNIHFGPDSGEEVVESNDSGATWTVTYTDVCLNMQLWGTAAFSYPTDPLLRVTGITRTFWAGKTGQQGVYQAQINIGGSGASYIPPVTSKEMIPTVPTTKPTQQPRQITGLPIQGGINQGIMYPGAGIEPFASGGTTHQDYVKWVMMTPPGVAATIFGHYLSPTSTKDYEEWVKRVTH